MRLAACESKAEMQPTDSVSRAKSFRLFFPF